MAQTIQERREKGREYCKKWREKNKDRIAKFGKEYRLKNSDNIRNFSRNYNLNKIYKISREDYDSLKNNQGNCCAICKKNNPNGRELSIDHCHLTGKVRGLLCHKCNTGLGHFNDNIEILKLAIDYLIF